MTINLIIEFIEPRLHNTIYIYIHIINTIKNIKSPASVYVLP